MLEIEQSVQLPEHHGKTKVWNAKLVEEVRDKIVNGKTVLGGTPFYEGDIDYRAGDIIYDYSQEELREIAKCATDVVYFANNYCQSMTDDGVQRIKLRDYQEEVLRGYQNHRFTVFLASRQIGKTVMTGIFITWYILFNIDKNVMILANIGKTAAEIVDKIKTVVKGLPFFLKPGIDQNNVMAMKFDNGCRIMAQSTTKTAAIGFTIHLAFMDEFAHIHNNFIASFYRSVYPTISSSQISRVIITSTPNGRNKFWEIYSNAIKQPGEEGKNEYFPLRVDWWDVPGRDEAWKNREIAQLGSEELFNQEYGNQFLAADSLLLSSNSLRFLKKLVVKYKWQEIEKFEDTEVDYKNLTWHPKFQLYAIDENDRFFISIDIGDGVGRDYSVINIFKVQQMSISSMKRVKKDRVENESSFYRLVQVGLYRSNTVSVEELARISEVLFFDFFTPEHLTVAVELNFKGDFFLERLKKNEMFFDEMFLHTRHNEKNAYTSLGVKLHKHNKMLFCRELRKLIFEKRIILTEEKTFEEMSVFGINNKGTYSSQSGNDDIAMTTVYASPFISSNDFSYVIEEIVDLADENFKKEMYKILESEKSSDVSNYSVIKEFM